MRAFISQLKTKLRICLCLLFYIMSIAIYNHLDF